MNKCKTHNVELEWLGGCSAHPDNRYCPQCEKEEIMKLKPCFCGADVRWCGDGDESCGNHDCDHIHCDSCNMHFSLESPEARTAETFADARALMAKAWNTRVREKELEEALREAAKLMEQSSRNILEDANKWALISGANLETMAAKLHQLLGDK